MLACCQPCGRTAEQSTNIGATLLAAGVLQTASEALAAANASSMDPAPALSVLEVYAPLDPAAAAAALPHVTAALTALQLNTPPAAATSLRLPKMASQAAAGCASAAQRLNIATPEQAAALAQAFVAVRAAAVLATLSGAAKSGLEPPARMEAAKHALAELATAGDKLAACTHPLLMSVDAGGPALRAAAAARLTAAMAVLRAVVDGAGAPVQLAVKYPVADIPLRVNCGPCGIVTGKPHTVAFVLSDWHFSPEYSAGRYGAAPPVRVGLQTMSPPPAQAMNTAVGATPSVNPLFKSDAQAPAAAEDDLPAADT